MENNLKIFEFLYKNPDNEYNINQIARIVGISVGSAFKILKEFEKESYVTGKQRKNAIFYHINLNQNTRDVYYNMSLESNKSNKKKTKIICTIGPSSNNVRIIKNLIEEGMDCARINASHCGESSASGIIRNIRKASENIPILLDIPGPKIRLKDIPNPINIKKGDIIKIVFKESDTNKGLFIDAPVDLHRYVNKGHRIFIDDGKIELLVLEANSKHL